MSRVDRPLQEVRYLKGEVLNDPQIWSETKVSGGGGSGTGHYRSNIRISSTVDTWTSFLIETDSGKEFMVKWPESASVRKGHIVKVAVFRDETIAFVNEKTDTSRYLTNLVVVKWWSEAKAFPSLVSYGSLAAFILPLFIESLQWVSVITVFIWLTLLVIGLFRKKLIYDKVNKNFATKVLEILKEK
ncbi:MAG: hypothetical protein ABJ275_07465 [Maricaulaceae bacterium]